MLNCKNSSNIFPRTLFLLPGNASTVILKLEMTFCLMISKIRCTVLIYWPRLKLVEDMKLPTLPACVINPHFCLAPVHNLLNRYGFFLGQGNSEN